MRISIVTLFFLLASNLYALDDSRMKSLTELMVVGCSLGQTLEIEAGLNGKLSIIKQGAKANFNARQSEIPSIIRFIASDELKGEQANQTRQCMQHYMDKIFAVVLNKTNTEFVLSNKNGVLYKLHSCNKIERNNLECQLTITSSYQDRELSTLGEIFDDSGNQYFASSIAIANHKRSDKKISRVPLIADVPMKMSLTFNNVSTNAKALSLLKISTTTKTNGKLESSSVSFREITINQ
ncbi:hypothetical protein [Pleionea sp. CnH1-48]|uniref:hypothetical protein n=1 Tax=Pleionea sp. CnH1-48 TaxID=2954494 RepID=UPI002097D97D|nr:hypothetical protein [Pleionea sp. CnH1-48]MCO7227342.1 hypothetical protein [Pleionea sp. CnH1-48]